MGGRLSVPRGPGGTTEASRLPAASSSSNPLRRRYPLNLSTLAAPAAVVLLGTLFFVYSRTTITAAKENARRHREADGGSISWRNEALRRHGVLEKPEERTLLQELMRKKKQIDGPGDAEEGDGKAPVKPQIPREVNPIEEGIRKARERSAKAAQSVVTEE